MTINTSTIRYLGAAAWRFCLAIFIYYTREMESYFRIGCISTRPYGHLFISPIFPTKIFISRKLQPTPQYSNGGPLKETQIKCVVSTIRRTLTSQSYSCLQPFKYQDLFNISAPHPCQTKSFGRNETIPADNSN